MPRGSNLRVALLGRDRRRTMWSLLGAVALFTGTLGLLAAIPILDGRYVPIGIDGAWVLWAAGVVAVGAPAVQAYENEGLLASVALGLAVPLAFFVALTAFDLVSPSESVLWGVRNAVTFGVPAGLLGFVLGVAGRRIRASRTPNRDRSDAR